MKSLQCDALKVFACTSRPEMGALAAERCVHFIKKCLAQKQEINMIFAAAPSQNEMLDALVASDVDFSRINAFHMDEYVGLEPGTPQTFGYYLTQHLFSRVNFKSVHLINTANGADAACAEYAALLEKYPTDIVCMGIGENGHIAFNDPPVADFADPLPIKRVALDEICRQQQVNDGCFPTLADVPTHAVTLTVPTLMRAAHIICTVPAPTKAAAVKATLEGRIGEHCPATALRRHACAEMFLDADSAALVEALQ